MVRKAQQVEGKQLQLLFGSAPFTHDLCEQDFLTRDVMTETAQDEEENSPSDCDGRPEMGVTRV